jgi:Ca2+-binding RTX toxin-like protein
MRRRLATLTIALLATAVVPAAADARWQNSAGVYYDDDAPTLCACRNGVRLRVAVRTETAGWTAVRVIVTRSPLSHEQAILIDEVVPLARVTPRTIEVENGTQLVDHIGIATLRYASSIPPGAQIVVYTQHASANPFDFGTVGAGTAIVYPTRTTSLKAAAPTTRCLGRRATMLGTRRGERLTGTPGNDVIVARGGNDIVNGRGGDDVICAGSGHDRVTTGAGRSVVLGESGNDRLVDGAGEGVLVAGSGRDRLLGGGGDDVVAGGRNDDTVDGGDGADTLFGEDGADQLRPGSSPDIGGSPNQLVEGGAGDDTLRYDNGWDAIDGGTGRDLLGPAAGAPAFTVLAGPDSVSGNFDGSACLVLLTDCAAPFPAIPYASYVYGIERMHGTEGADRLQAPLDSPVPVEIHGLGGDDVLSGSNGADHLVGGGGSDSVDGRVGADVCEGETLVSCP